MRQKRTDNANHNLPFPFSPYERRRPANDPLYTEVGTAPQSQKSRFIEAYPSGSPTHSGPEIWVATLDGHRSARSLSVAGHLLYLMTPPKEPYVGECQK